MLTQGVTGPQAWLTRTRLADTPLADCATEVRPALHALEHGRGFVILRGLPLERYAADDLQRTYWLVGQLLGQPVAQNVHGTLLYDVRDTGQDVRYGTRFSVTNAESTFHTDKSFGDTVVDYVGLLCLQTARSGGFSQMVSFHAAHNRLLQEHPEVLEVLYQPLHVDRRGGTRPGEAPTVRVPIFHWDGRALLCRYLRYWIEAGHEKAGRPFPWVAAIRGNCSPWVKSCFSNQPTPRTARSCGAVTAAWLTRSCSRSSGAVGRARLFPGGRRSSRSRVVGHRSRFRCRRRRPATTVAARRSAADAGEYASESRGCNHARSTAA